MYEEDYHEVIWSHNLKDDEVASLHIFTVTPEYQGQGVSKRMMAEIISLAMEKGKKAIRLDTLVSNIPAQHMYEELGFAYRGKQNLYAENTGWTDFPEISIESLNLNRALGYVEREQYEELATYVSQAICNLEKDYLYQPGN